MVSIEVQMQLNVTLQEKAFKLTHKNQTDKYSLVLFYFQCLGIKNGGKLLKK